MRNKSSSYARKNTLAEQIEAKTDLYNNLKLMENKYEFNYLKNYIPR